MWLYNLKRNRAKKVLTKKVKAYKAWAQTRPTNENIAINQFKLAEIVMLRQQFLPWGKYFYVESYGFAYCRSLIPEINEELESMGCGTLDQILAIDLRHGRHCAFYRSGRLWVDSMNYSRDFPRCNKCSID